MGSGSWRCGDRGVTRRSEEPRLNVYNWSDYIAPDTIPKFEAETGITVTYDVYDGNEVLEAKLLVRPVGLRCRRAVGEPLHGAADRGRGLPGARQIEARRLAEPRSRISSSWSAAADPGNEHGAPYLWSDTGIGYNETQVHAALGEAAPGTASR